MNKSIQLTTYNRTTVKDNAMNDYHCKIEDKNNIYLQSQSEIIIIMIALKKEHLGRMGA